jgi:hypothetical protein
MLGPDCPGFCDAHQEIIRWVTSLGDHAPVSEQICFGWLASVTLARMSAGDPFITSRASWAAGCPVQLALIEAQAGTSGVGEGDGDGDGDGLVDGLGLGLGDGEGDGELCEATFEVELPQPTRTTTDRTASTPTLRLTGQCNENGWDGVTGRAGDTGR